MIGALPSRLREDAEFLRKLRPALVAQRLRRGGPPPEPEPAAVEPRNEAARRLARLADRAEERGGPAARLAPLLREDAAFVSRIDPAGIRSRLPRPSPVLVLGASFVAGFATARALAWRAHAHPRQ